MWCCFSPQDSIPQVQIFGWCARYTGQCRGGSRSWLRKYERYQSKGGQCMPMQKSFSAADPAIVPVKGPMLSEGNTTTGQGKKPGSQATAPSNPYGPNNERLPEKLEGALRLLRLHLAGWRPR